MIGPAAVRRIAADTGFREEAVEKVLYLTAILGRLRTHPDLRNAWVLKGGTAINLQRIPLLGAEQRRPRLPFGGEAPEVPVLTLPIWREVAQ